MKKMYVFYMYIEIRIQKTIKHYIKNIHACVFKYDCIFNSRFAAMLLVERMIRKKTLIYGV